VTYSYTFHDDIDRNNASLPAEQRAGLTIYHDGEHVVFGVHEHEQHREIYLAPERARVAARLILQLTDEHKSDDDQEMSLGRALLTVAWFFASLAVAGYLVYTGVAGLVRLIW
jgi:hypothetical protein